MTAVTMTANVVLDEASARKLTNRIKLLLGPFLDQRDKLLTMLAEARNGNAHEALGYRSWSEYMSLEFRDHLPRLSREDRRALVGDLADAGMPTRAIGPVVGVSQSTVVSDLAAREQNRSPDRVVTGRDGKNYTIPTSSTTTTREISRHRRPLPDAYRDAVYELQKAIERLERLHADDRFKANQPTMARHHIIIGELSTRTTELARHLLGTDDELGQWKKRGQAKYLTGDLLDDDPGVA